MGLGLAKRVVYWRTPYSNGWFLVPREICNGRLVQATSGVDVNGVGDFLGGLAHIGQRRQHILVLAGRSEQQAAVWCERQTAEKRCKSFVGIYGSISDTAQTWMGTSCKAANARRIGHDGG